MVREWKNRVYKIKEAKKIFFYLHRGELFLESFIIDPSLAFGFEEFIPASQRITTNESDEYDQ